MTGKQELSEKWIKASVLGTIWASSEIVLGSFLHNLKVPFSGNILTAIALVILISASYKWKEKGLFWRAGLLCALMKTISPSAVIFGPMIAIFTEALLLEISVRIFGMTILGYITGSVLAMSWVLFQKIANYVIFYGYNLVRVYESIMQFAQKQFHWQFDAVWMPVLVLVVIYGLFGAFSAIIGMRTGRRLADPETGPALPYKAANTRYSWKQPGAFNYSLYWLSLDVLLVICALALANYLPFLAWAILIVCIVTTWAIRYKRALRQLVRPKFWIFFAFITMITAIVFTRIQSTNGNIWEGVQIGIEMNLRAIMLIMGFTVLGTELYNPKILNYLQKGRFKQLTLALELSFGALPSMIANTPDLKTMVKHPAGVMYQLFTIADQRLHEIRDGLSRKPKVSILAGDRDEGKTANLQFMVDKLQSQQVVVGGIYSPKVIENGVIKGYDVVDIMTGERYAFLRKEGVEGGQKIGSYYIIPEGLEKGLKAIEKAIAAGAEVIVIDEVGRLEIQGKGWAPSIEALMHGKDYSILMTVRREFLEEVINQWNLSVNSIFDSCRDNPGEYLNYLLPDTKI